MADLYDVITDKNNNKRYRKNKQFTKEANVPPAALEALTDKNMVDENGLVVIDDKGAENAAEEGADNAADTSAAPAADPDNDGIETDQPTPGAEQALDTNENPNAADEQAAAESEADLDAGTDPDADQADSEEDSSDTTPPAAPPAPVTDPDEDAAEDPAPPVDPPTPKKRAKRNEAKFVSKVPQSKPGMGFPRKNGKTVDIFDGVTPHTHLKLVGGYTVPLSTENFESKTEKQISDRLEELGYELIDFSDRSAAPDTDVTDENDDDDDDGSLTDDRV